MTEDHTEQTALAVQAVQTSIAGIDKIREGLSAIEAEHPKDLVIDGSTTAGMRALVAARAAWRDPRIAVEKARKDAKAPVLALGREIDAYAAELTEQLRVGEENYDSQIKAIEAKKAAERAERERQETEARQKQIARVLTLRGVPQTLIGASVEELDAATARLMDDDLADLDEVYKPDGIQAREKSIEDLQVMRAQRAEQDAKDAELAELRERAAAQERELQEQRDREAAERAEREEADRQARADRELEEKRRARREQIASGIINRTRDLGLGLEGQTSDELAARIELAEQAQVEGDDLDGREGEALLAKEQTLAALRQAHTYAVYDEERARKAQEAEAEAEAQRQAEAERAAQAQREAQEQAIREATLRTAAEAGLALLEREGFGQTVEAAMLRSALEKEPA